MFTFETDPRMVVYPLIGNPVTGISIILVYLLFVKILGPAYMKNREPYSLRNLIVVYNFGLVAINAFIVYKLWKYGWGGRYSWYCEPVQYNVNPEEFEVVRAGWFYFFTKYIELLDTVFFILRKKYSQVSFLHVIHHATVPVITQFSSTHGASGFATLTPFINSFVHVLMYTYYALAAVGPSMQKYLWWKKYLTKIQIIQFCIVIVLMTFYALNPSCDADLLHIITNIAPCLFFLILFMGFYESTYKEKPVGNPYENLSKKM